VTQVLGRVRAGERARRFWREYTRMRTAIAFLIGLVLIVLIGSFVPQQDTSEQAKVDEFLQNHPNLNSLASHLGLPLTEVFVSPLLYVLLGSLYIALAACVIRRGRALLVRTMRGYPRTPQYWGEWGSWLFHSSFFLLLIAVVWGKATGFEGLMTVTEGVPVTEARADFATLREGLLFDGHHAGYQMTLNKFTVTYQPNGQPNDFVSNVTVSENGKPMLTKDIRVNDFLGYRDVDFYQQDFGWAPQIRVTNPRGEVVFDAPVQFFGDQKNAQVGVLKVPGFNYTIPGAAQQIQLGAKMVVFPDARTTATVGPDGSVTPGSTNFGPGGNEARNPVLQVQLFVGDLGLGSGRPQNVNDLDTTAMQPYFTNATPFPVPMGQTVQLPLNGTDCKDPVASGCFKLEFTKLPQYSLFRVKKDDGVPFVYASFALVMVGLLTKLYLRPLLERRRRRSKGGGPGRGGDAGGEPGYAWVASAADTEAEPSPAPTTTAARSGPGSSTSSGGT
jgi:cytochrome c biogenesis protein